ncbi:MAG TPA: LD-carboxypeptidase [Kofleriaceae bacterium]|nr:LD-carboxypeptidase [Kofleriaceae bacterium]
MSQSTVVPPRVRAGDTVAIVAPASPVPPDRLRAGLDRLGDRYRLRVADDIGRASGFLAGSDSRRAEELDAALRDPDVRAVIMARGGYGVHRLLEHLDPGALRADPKPLVGFSDGTALLAWAERAGVRGVHGPVVVQLPRLPAEQVAWLFDLLEGRAALGAGAPLATGLVPVGAPGRGRVEGPLRGGNLTLLSHLVGTPWQPDLAGALLLLEEVDEKPYAIDRYLTHMALAGALAGAAGALIGDLTACTDAKYPDVSGEDAVAERLRGAGLPALAGAPVGHGARNLALPYGARCALDLDAGTLELLEPAVS